MSITQYMVEDVEGNPVVTHVFAESEYQEADKLAATECGKVVAYEYEFADSYTVDDYTWCKEHDAPEPCVRCQRENDAEDAWGER